MAANEDVRNEESFFEFVFLKNHFISSLRETNYPSVAFGLETKSNLQQSCYPKERKEKED